MFHLIASVFAALCSSFRTYAPLQLEILAFQHQINVLGRAQRGHARLNRVVRFLWVCLWRLWANWRAALVIVKPETVIAWHRKGFSLYWTWKTARGE
jgi:hypothetical protein